VRRGRQARLRAGTLLPWTRPPFGYRLDPDRPRDAAAVRVEPGEAVLVAQLFDWYLEPRATLYGSVNLIWLRCAPLIWPHR
jgi:site-specific DNA recombinase